MRAILRDSPRFLTTAEVEDALGRGAYYSDIFSALQHLHEEGAVSKIRHPLLKNVLWGMASKDRGLGVDYALLRQAYGAVKIALARAPEPSGTGQWMAQYREWWNDERKEALNA